MLRRHRRIQLSLSEKEPNELPDDSTNIFKKLNIDRNTDRSNTLFSDGKYSALDNFCYAKFSGYYTTDNKLDHSREYHKEEFEDKLIEENDEES